MAVCGGLYRKMSGKMGQAGLRTVGPSNAGPFDLSSWAELPNVVIGLTAKKSFPISIIELPCPRTELLVGLSRCEMPAAIGSAHLLGLF
jgi:hypothetical protein